MAEGGVPPEAGGDAPGVFPGEVRPPLTRREHAEAPAPLVPRGGAAGAASLELVRAFQANADAMQGMREVQAELVRALRRQDRSELVLQSTQALNDTFRNLAAIQRTLVQRLEEPPPRSGMGRLVPLMLIALLVVLLGGLYLVLDVLDLIRKGQPDTAAIAERTGDSVLTAYREGRVEAERASARELERLEGQLGEVAERERVLRQRLDEETGSSGELEGQLRAIEAERDGLAAQVLAARNEMMARRAVEEEMRGLQAEKVLTDRRLADLEASIASERAENQRLRKRLAALGLGLPDEEPAPAVVPPDAPAPAEEASPPGPVPVGEAPPTAPTRPPPAVRAPRVDRDAVLLERVRGRMNEILQDGARGRDEVWQVTRIEGVSTEGLHGVTALLYDAQGRLQDQVEAERLSIWVDRDQHNVELEFTAGRSGIPRAPRDFPGGVLRRRVAEGEMTRLWSQSGMGFLRYR